MNLTESAARYGVHADGKPVPDSTLRAIIDACEADASAIPAAVVVKQSEQSAIRLDAVPAGSAPTAALTLEDGRERGLDTVRDAGSVAVHVPAGLPCGYHRIEIAAGDLDASVRLIIAPDVLEPPERIGTRRHWGYDFAAPAVRSDLSWGIGDFADIAEFAGLAERHGASFLAAAPLHAPAPAMPIEASPYAACTRGFLSPLLIRVEDIREVAYMPAATRTLIDWEAADQRAANDSAAPMDLDDIWEAKKNALSLVFAHPRSPARQASLDRFVRAGGPGLDAFCRWCAACEYFGPDDAKWPAAVRTGANTDTQFPDAAVEDFRRHADERRDFYAWLQWIADGQLAAAAGDVAGASSADAGAVAEDATGQGDATEGSDATGDAAEGSRIGLVTSTVVSATLGPADAWRYREYVAHGVRAASGPGGPAPILTPGALRAVGFAPVIDAVRAALRHAGGLRLDRPSELFRSWLVPDGAAQEDGAWIDMDADELIGIVLLEAQRAGAVALTGDAAGLRDDERERLATRGIAVERTVWDETAAALVPADSWSVDSVAAVSPHGTASTSAFLSGEHLDTAEPDAEARRLAHEKLRDGAVASLRRMKLVDKKSTERDILEALYAYAASTPARYVAVAIADAVGDRQPVGRAGTPNSRIPLADGAGRAVTLGRLAVNPRAADLAGKLTAIR